MTMTTNEQTQLQTLLADLLNISPDTVTVTEDPSNGFIQITLPLAVRTGMQELGRKMAFKHLGQEQERPTFSTSTNFPYPEIDSFTVTINQTNTITEGTEIIGRTEYPIVKSVTKKAPDITQLLELLHSFLPKSETAEEKAGAAPIVTVAALSVAAVAAPAKEVAPSGATVPGWDLSSMEGVHKAVQKYRAEYEAKRQRGEAIDLAAKVLPFLDHIESRFLNTSSPLNPSEAMPELKRLMLQWSGGRAHAILDALYKQYELKAQQEAIAAPTKTAAAPDISGHNPFQFLAPAVAAPHAADTNSSTPLSPLPVQETQQPLAAEVSPQPVIASPPQQTPADALFQSGTWTQFETSAQTKFGNKWDGFKAAVTRIINDTTEPAHKIQALKALKHDEQFKSVLKGTPGERFLNFILHVGAYFKAGFGEKNKENRRDYRHGVQADSTSKFFRPDRRLLQEAKYQVAPTSRPKSK